MRGSAGGYLFIWWWGGGCERVQLNVHRPTALHTASVTFSFKVKQT